MVKRSNLAWLTLAIFLFSFIGGMSLAHQAALATQRSVEEQAAASQELDGALSSSVQARQAAASIPRLAVVKKYGAMEKSMAALASKRTGQLSIGFYDLENDYQYILAPGAMPSASVIKIYIMIEAYRQARDKILDLQDIHILQEEEKTSGSGKLLYYPAGSPITLEELVELMIVESDNTAANILISRLGMDNINALIEELGCQDTRLKWKLMTDEILVERDDNPVSCRDLILTLKKIYCGQCVSPELDQEMIGVMTRQTYRSRIPAGLPPGTRVANKTGTLSWVINDAAIVFAPEGDYILCVLQSQPYSKSSGESAIIEISALVYKAFTSNPEEAANHKGR